MKSKLHHPILLAAAVVGAVAAAVSAAVSWRKRHPSPPVVVVTLPGVEVKGEEREPEAVERPAPVSEGRRRAVGEP